MDNQTSNLNPQTKNPDAYKAILTIGEQGQNLIAKEGYWKAYLLSVFLPPIGIYYFVKYFFFADGSSESWKAAIICLLVTIISLALNVWFIRLFFSQSTPGGSQNLDIIKELITPENQKSLRQLLQ